jgi:hypothetical protein
VDGTRTDGLGVRGVLSVGLIDDFEDEGDGEDEDGDFELDGDGEGDFEEEPPDFPLLPPPPLPPPPLKSFGEPK